MTETIVFLYMGMGVFTGKFKNWSITFASLAFLFCVIGRAANIFPLSIIANLSRKKNNDRITLKMQFVLWFAGLRGAIAFALAENMPGPNRETYASATLTICIITTVICGGFTEKILTKFGMKQDNICLNGAVDDYDNKFPIESSVTRKEMRRVYKGLKGLWKHFDNTYLKEQFGGSQSTGLQGDTSNLGNYELTCRSDSDSDDGLTAQL